METLIGIVLGCGLYYVVAAVWRAVVGVKPGR